jgi:hypothetical protein
MSQLQFVYACECGYAEGVKPPFAGNYIYRPTGNRYQLLKIENKIQRPIELRIKCPICSSTIYPKNATDKIIFTPHNGKNVNLFNKKFGDLATATMDVKIHMLPFEKSPNQEMSEIAKSAGKKINLNVKIQSFHAGAETHIYANKTNKYGAKFKPVLVGVANISSMHSPNESMEIESLKKGYEFIKEIFLEYNK